MVVNKVVFTSMLLVCPWLGTAYAEEAPSSASASSASSESVSSESVESVESASSASSSTTAAETVEGLEAVRKQCLELRADSQRKPFQIKVECSGSYSYWVKEAGRVSLPNQSTTNAQTTTKAGRYRSVGVVTSVSMPDHDVSCTRWKKKQLSVPEGFGIPKLIEECDELTPANLKQICADEVREYCGEQMVAGSSSSQSGSSSSDGAQQGQGAQQDQSDKSEACVLKTVKVFDACAGYQ